jgi:hypothetical protein
VKRPLTLFLSSGRSGTQWVAKVCSELYSDLAEVVHEPIEFHYRPKLTLRTNAYEKMRREVPEIRAHLEHIAEVLESGKAYVETGWPVFSWIPYFHEKYGRQLRLVHLTRHPIYFACSLATHEFYQPNLKNDGFTQYTQLEPTDQGIAHKEYQRMWAGLSPHEKCLFQWLEIHTYAFELQETYPEVPFLRLRMEDLFDPDQKSSEELIRFLEFPLDRFSEHAARERVVDKYHRKTIADFAPQKMQNHTEVTRLAERLGYDVRDYDLSKIQERYSARTYRWLIKTLWSYFPKQRPS